MHNSESWIQIANRKKGKNEKGFLKMKMMIPYLKDPRNHNFLIKVLKAISPKKYRVEV